MSPGDLSAASPDFPPYRAVEVQGGTLRLGRCIARGAGGSAVHTGVSAWGEPLAIKILAPGETGATERDALVACRHPRIVHLHATFEHEGRMHLALQHGGLPLSSHAPFERPGERLTAAMRVAAAVLEALHFMHRFGFSHGAVAPRHVLIQPPRSKEETAPQLIRLCGLSASGRHGADAIARDVADARALVRGLLGEPKGDVATRVAALLDSDDPALVGGSASRLWTRLAAAHRG